MVFNFETFLASHLLVVAAIPYLIIGLIVVFIRSGQRVSQLAKDILDNPFQFLMVVMMLAVIWPVVVYWMLTDETARNVTDGENENETY